MVQIRNPAVAGAFYPGDPVELLSSVRGYLKDAHVVDVAAPKALIAPHAGYVYSGPIAGSAYAPIAPLRGQIERVVLLGPAHRVPVRGLAVPSCDAFETPLGLVAIDLEAGELLQNDNIETMVVK